jgi:DNA-binding phage protein
MAKTKAVGKPKASVKTVPWDSAAYLRTPRDVAGYLEAVFEEAIRR